MPYADCPDVARHWASERAVSLWAIFADDIPAAELEALAAGLGDARADGARVAVVVPPEGTAGASEQAVADLTVTGPPAPAPFGLFAALEAAGIGDVRQLGVLGASPAAIAAAHRAGAGAIVGVAAAAPAVRWPLLPAQPDVIVAAGEFAALDAERYASGRAHRERVLLNPGPAVVSDRVHRAVGGPDLCHREPEYSDILDGVRRKLLGWPASATIGRW